MTLSWTHRWQRMTIGINFWYVSNFLSTSAWKISLIESTHNTLHEREQWLYFVTVQARAYGEAAHVPGAHEKDRGLWCEIETHFKVSVYHNWPPHVNMFRGGALKINPNKVYIFWKLNKWRIWLRFFFFQEHKSFLNFAQRSDIYPFFFFKFVYSHDYRRNVFNIANDSLHIAFQKDVSDFSKIASFSFYTTLKFDVRKLVISFNKQSHKFLTRLKFKSLRHPFVGQLFGNIYSTVLDNPRDRTMQQCINLNYSGLDTVTSWGPIFWLWLSSMLTKK